MKQAIIDIGSNSIRLTLYETEGENFHILFREKIMAGLAGYVEDGKLSAEGIECACAGLLTFRSILQTLEIEHISVFATASLRNISKTEQALCRAAENGKDVLVLMELRARFDEENNLAWSKNAGGIWMSGNLRYGGLQMPQQDLPDYAPQS